MSVGSTSASIAAPPRTAVVIPTYCEADNLPALAAALDRLDPTVDVVDDDSPDGTGAIADGLAS